MALTLADIDHGVVEEDGLGESPFTAAQKINANNTLIETDVLLADGSNALTANWSAGAYDISPRKIIFDSAQTYGATTGMSFGDGDTRIYETSNDVVVFDLNNAARFIWTFNQFSGNLASSGTLRNETATATNPVLVIKGDVDTGVGSAGPDIFSAIAGGVEAVRSTEVAGAIVNDLTGVATLITGHTIAGLPTPATGMIARITDGDAALAWGATAVNSGAGATPYLVWYNGTNWTVMGS